MNNVSIVGRITKDIELKTTQSGLSAVSVFIAVNNGKDKEGNKRQADFPKVYVYDKQAENLYKYCHKGSQIAITGSVKTRTWDKDDGSKGYETYIKANRVQFLDSKQSNGPEIPEPENSTNQASILNTEENPFDDYAEQEDLNIEDYPFED